MTASRARTARVVAARCVRSSASSGRDRSSSRRRRCQPVLRARHDEIFVDTGPALGRRDGRRVLRELGLAAPDHSLGVGGGTHAEQTAAMLTAARADPRRGAARRRPRLRRHELDPCRRAGRGQARDPASRTSRPGCAASIGGCPRSSTGSSPTTSRPGSSRRRPTAVENLRAEGITGGVVLVGDLMQDLAARVGREVATPAPCGGEPAPRRDRRRPRPARPAGTSSRRSIARRTGSRRRDARVGGPARPCRRGRIGRSSSRSTRDPARARARGHRAAAGVRLVEPQGYRTSLALQLHAAAVHHGLRRRPARGGLARRPVPGPARDDRVGRGRRRSGGRMVVVGLDAERGRARLGRARAARRRARPRPGSAPPRSTWRRPAPPTAIVAALEAAE